MTNKNYCDCRQGRDQCTCKAVEPVPPAGGEPQVVGYMQDRSDGEPLITLESHQSYVAELRSKIKDLCDHPSMSFHQVALLEGVLDYVPDGEPVDRAHVTRLQAEVERLQKEADSQYDRRMLAVDELTKARKNNKELSAMLLKVRDSEVHEGRLLYDSITNLVANQSAPAEGQGEPVAWRVTGRGGLTVTPEYPKWAVKDSLLTITALYAEQPAPVAVATFKLISLPPSLTSHHAFDVLQEALAKVGVKVEEPKP